MKTLSAIFYRDYDISYNVYGNNEYTVQYCGDDVIFTSVSEAKKFIDEIHQHDNDASWWNG